MFLTTPDGIYQVLKTFDDHPLWPPDAKAVMIVVGEAALAFYHATTIDETDDLDGILWASSIAVEYVLRMAESTGISFRAGHVMWLPWDWNERIQWSGWDFQHLQVGWLYPYDWVISKLGRGLDHDAAHIMRMAPSLDPEMMYHRVRQALPDYIGDDRRVRGNWRDLVDAMGWPSSWREI
ncbi:hypothetical protein TPY_2720 [Sulfobacillus acidophilus TPY]|uniref:DUF6036 domain-containing protein n=1 Tax=Sulfobacillus acidophilus (strain ATCC 700253 / DSM 10332 / NAL) TaxID=679936 RepID=G8TUL3_SULAD|nr:hypothetical protein TPY_2720 [Sulfobacillus acidophilus TPY]AEW04660.1 hypothetical protein Sulac_1160 [Sulfobacillus acidophilus DSM 10332]